jgi:hypothetical protein
MGIYVGYHPASKYSMGNPEHIQKISVGQFQIDFAHSVVPFNFVQDFCFHFAHQMVLLTSQDSCYIPSGNDPRLDSVSDAGTAERIGEPPSVTDQTEIPAGESIQDLCRDSTEYLFFDPRAWEFVPYPSVEIRFRVVFCFER